MSATIIIVSAQTDYLLIPIDVLQDQSYIPPQLQVPPSFPTI